MANTLQRRIGKNIRQLRLSKGFSQEFVAEKLAISRNAFGSIERGESNPSIQRLGEIYSFFGIKLEKIFDNIKLY